MGVTGCGKSTLGQALALRLGWRFVEGDALHPEANIAKMAAGRPLDDEDRGPFLDNVARAIGAARAGGVVLSCSALKRGYRDRLRSAVPELVFVLPRVSRAALEQRLQQRTGHFMPAALLHSQLAILEPLQADEAGMEIDGEASTDAQVREVIAAAGAAGLIRN